MHLKISFAKWWPFCLGGDESRCLISLVTWLLVQKLIEAYKETIKAHHYQPFMKKSSQWFSSQRASKVGSISMSWCLMPLKPLHRDPLHIRWNSHDDVIKWEHFPHFEPFVWGIHQSPVNSPHNGQWHGALIFSLLCVWINGWVNHREAGDLRSHRAHYDVIVMIDIFMEVLLTISWLWFR